MFTTILVDVDDTILELVPEWLSKSNKIWGDNVKPSDIHSWEIGSYTKAGKDFYKLLTPDLYDNIKATPNSLEGIQYLRTISRVVFVTSGFGNNGKAKFDAMNKLGFEVNPIDFVEATDKSLIRGEYLIDDNFDNCFNFPELALLFSKPWNIKKYYPTRVSSWIDIINFFSEEDVL